MRTNVRNIRSSYVYIPLIIVIVLGIIVVWGAAKKNNQPINRSVPLKTDTTVIGIQTTNCCSCPTVINQSQIGKNGWIVYERGVNYSSALPEECKRVDCPVCEQLNNTKQYTCPSNGWVDCMPGPDQGKKIECTQSFLQWAKTNCPDFQGVAM